MIVCVVEKSKRFACDSIKCQRRPSRTEKIPYCWSNLKSLAANSSCLVAWTRSSRLPLRKRWVEHSKPPRKKLVNKRISPPQLSSCGEQSKRAEARVRIAVRCYCFDRNQDLLASIFDKELTPDQSPDPCCSNGTSPACLRNKHCGVAPPIGGISRKWPR